MPEAEWLPMAGMYLVVEQSQLLPPFRGEYLLCQNTECILNPMRAESGLLYIELNHEKNQKIRHCFGQKVEKMFFAFTISR